jgi:holo-[acyl-carrier protein] synthase
MILGIGIDIEKLDRFKNKPSGQFLKRVFAKDELDSHLTLLQIAGSFACKEAIIKAVFQATGRLLNYPDIIIIHRKNSPPRCRVASQGGNDNFLLSLSHNIDNVIAICLYQREPKRTN